MHPTPDVNSWKERHQSARLFPRIGGSSKWARGEGRKDRRVGEKERRRRKKEEEGGGGGGKKRKPHL